MAYNTRAMDFEWDPAKDRANKAKHGIFFGDVKELFAGGADYLDIYDAEHSGDEDRFIAIGPVGRSIVVVVYTEPAEGTVRIIGARSASASEARLFRRRMGEDR